MSWLCLLSVSSRSFWNIRKHCQFSCVINQWWLHLTHLCIHTYQVQGRLIRHARVFSLRNQQTTQTILFGSVKSSRSHNLRPSVRSFQTCLEQSIFMFLCQRALREQSSIQSIKIRVIQSEPKILRLIITRVMLTIRCSKTDLTRGR